MFPSVKGKIYLVGDKRCKRLKFKSHGSSNIYQKQEFMSGTYNKYNSGSAFGKWLEPSDYADKDESWKRVGNVHERGRKKPEVMFQDIEDMPEALIFPKVGFLIRS